MIVVNLWGGPGSGKSTTASGLFYKMKCQGLKVELVTEYAKDMVWEKRFNILDQDQLYILAKQHRRVARLSEQGLDYVITDSPIALGLVYLKTDYFGTSFPHVVMDLFNKFDNRNYLLQRNFAYDPQGRNQKDIHEAEIFDNRVAKLIHDNQIHVERLSSDTYTVDKILEDLGLTDQKTPI